MPVDNWWMPLIFVLLFGGAPGGPHDYHLLVAIFESVARTRVEDAEVAAVVEGLGHVGGRNIQLEPLVIGGTTTFGAFVRLPGQDRYQIRIEIRRSRGSAPLRAEFVYRHDAR